MCKEIANKGLEKADEIIKNASNTVLDYVIFLSLLLVGGIVGVSCFSSMPTWLNATILFILLALLGGLNAFSFYKAIKSPQTMIFNQTAYIVALREKLFDSDNQYPYYSNELPEKNTHSSNDDNIQLVEPIKASKKITASQ